MKVLRYLSTAGLVVAAFVIGLYGAPYFYSAYSLAFPEKAFSTGNYSGLYAEGTQVTLFSTSTCPYCKKARELFKKEGVQYTDYVVDESQEAASRFKGRGGGGVPLIYIGKREIRGFRQSAIEEALSLIRSG